MNDLLEQFLAECRDLIDAATMDLLALETAPDDGERLDGAFRCFHTLKGAAGIVDFAAMGRLLHAAEEGLSAVRAGSRAVTGGLISDCLACLDQVARWLDEVAAGGEIPAVPADAADALAARFSAPDPSAATLSTPLAGANPSAGANPPDWVAPFLARHRSVGREARAALRHTPTPDCFLRGADPLGLIAGIPGLLAMEVTPLGEWPPLDELDPFRCGLVVTALTAAAAGDVTRIMRAGPGAAGAGEFEVWPLTGTPVSPDALAASPAADAETPLASPPPPEALAVPGVALAPPPEALAPPPEALDVSPEARAVLWEQARMAANDAVDGLGGRLASAGLVAANVLLRAGWPDAARAVADAARTARSEGSGKAFIAALRAVLDHAAPDDAEPDDPAPGHAPPGHATPDHSPPGHAAPDDAAPDHTPSGHAPPGHTPPDDVAPRLAAPDRAQTARALRVDVERIDALVSLVGELTVAKNAIGHTARLARGAPDPASLARALKDQHATLDRLVNELQRAVLGVRVLPLRHVFQHFPRLVREMARDLGKTVRLEIEGETTEADKATVEALFEPLLHVLRNALDHGVEPAAERAAAGKPESATVRLRAARDGDRVIVEVADDGRGIDPAKLRLAAARRGVATEAALAELADQAVVELIFAPGFSTAAAITGLSGRGVGMDAVRAAVTRLGGSVAVTSQPGAGTSVVFTLPFTILMLRVMTVGAGGQIFGVPIDAVVETVRLPRDRIARLGAAEAIVLRDRTVPLIRLAEMLDLPPADRPAPDGEEASILVATAGGPAGAEQFCALEVESFGERMDVMLRPMEGLLAGVSGFAGTTLVGDGGVLIVLDLQELLRCEEVSR